ncbi:hypothetical protein DE146DRAFT_660005 [Phaeosphaeria sp. MPI-PUGE-AT-0046c]|nr:hypothetical protein DE146DRAFT_660005 [Phaeosphaeria sp. MPI-PUGE-AT-0046c]
MSSPIPIVDFAPARQGSREEQEAVARELDRAFREVGFVYLRNCGLRREMVREGFEWSQKFFSLPLSTKLLAPHPPGGAHHRGYSAPGVEKVSQHTYDANELNKLRNVPDYKESFESGNVNDPTQPNIWLPDPHLPGFKPFMQHMFTACETLIHQILSTLSIALSVPPPGLSPTHSQSLFQLRLLHYPSLAASELRNARRSRINAHSDFGTLTLLFQDAVGGLELESPPGSGIFRPAPPVEDAVLVNVGDLLARWSNDRYMSTVHRVGMPAEKSAASAGKDGDGGGGLGDEVVPERYSIPFFATADPETVIEALPGCWGPGNEKRYESVTAAGYVRMRMEALYQG